MGFATGKAHKRETQGKYFYLLFLARIFSMDFKISAIIRVKIYTRIF
jgi:hypothetical protein